MVAVARFPLPPTVLMRRAPDSVRGKALKHPRSVKSCGAVAAADIPKGGERAIAEAYDRWYRPNEIASHLGVRYASVSRRLREIEQKRSILCHPKNLAVASR